MIGVLVGIAVLAAAPVHAEVALKEAWVTLTPMLQPQAESAAVVLNGRIYVMGGWGSGGSESPFTVVQVYDIANNRWSEGAPLPQPIHHAGAAVVGGKIAPLPTPRGALAVGVAGNLIYAAGGEQRRPPGSVVPKGGNPDYVPVTDFAVYDTQTDRWEVLPPMKHPREHVVGGVIGGRFYAVGGRDRPKFDLAYLEEYDPATKTWREREAMPTGRSGGAGAVLDGRLYVFGGEGNPASPIGIFSEVEAYDAANGKWLTFGPMPTPRHSIPAAVAGGRIYLPGGTPRADSLRPRNIVSEVLPLLDAFSPPK
jgi:N-acetylneuraminic acid mutarotase